MKKLVFCFRLIHFLRIIFVFCLSRRRNNGLKKVKLNNTKYQAVIYKADVEVTVKTNEEKDLIEKKETDDQEVPYIEEEKQTSFSTSENQANSMA